MASATLQSLQISSLYEKSQVPELKYYWCLCYPSISTDIVSLPNLKFYGLSYPSISTDIVSLPNLNSLIKIVLMLLPFNLYRYRLFDQISSSMASATLQSLQISSLYQISSSMASATLQSLQISSLYQHLKFLWIKIPFNWCCYPSISTDIVSLPNLKFYGLSYPSISTDIVSLPNLKFYGLSYPSISTDIVSLPNLKFYGLSYPSISDIVSLPNQVLDKLPLMLLPFNLYRYRLLPNQVLWPQLPFNLYRYRLFTKSQVLWPQLPFNLYRYRLFTKSQVLWPQLPFNLYRYRLFTKSQVLRLKYFWCCYPSISTDIVSLPNLKFLD